MVQVFLLVFATYLLLNVFFGLIYYGIGIEEITNSTGSEIKDFFNGFFFSAQTITTVGYGGISPQGFIGNLISTFEALLGLLGFSFITGLLYGRFSKPKASVSFSENIILRDFKEGKALMFRLMNNRTNMMIELEISVMMAFSKENEKGEFKREFYNLKLEHSKIKYLPTTWTIVHEIDDESPLVKLKLNEIKELKTEWYILLQYHDDSFAQKVYQIKSYEAKDLLSDVQFIPATYFNQEGFTVLNHNELSSIKKM